MINEPFDYVKYLDAKKTIDDRSLNTEVWREFSSWLVALKNQKESLQIMEIGAGIGTMIERLLDASLLGNCCYTALEPEASFKQAAKHRLQRWAELHQIKFTELTEDSWLLRGGEIQLNIKWFVEQAENIGILFKDGSFDLLLSHAVIDLLPVPDIMPIILRKLRNQGAYYYSLNFSGSTKFYPEHQNDELIIRYYHEDMDKRFPELDWKPSLTGLELPGYLKQHDCIPVADGDSTWKLGEHDKLFIGNIIETINKALQGLPELDAWFTERCEQHENGQLRLEISNGDCFGLK